MINCLYCSTLLLIGNTMQILLKNQWKIMRNDQINKKKNQNMFYVL